MIVSIAQQPFINALPRTRTSEVGVFVTGHVRYRAERSVFLGHIS